MAMKAIGQEKKQAAPSDKKPRKKVKYILVASGVIVVLLVGGGFLFFRLKGNNFANFPQNTDFSQTASASLDAVTAYGVINIGSIEETLEIENLTTNLQIEKILFSTGDRVTEGTALLTFTEDSVASALEELSENLKEADLAYRAGAIEYEQSLITAKFNYDSTILKGKQADAVYEETVATLKSNLESATKTYNEAVEQLAAYKDAQANDTYYTEYNVAYYKQLYEENLAVLKTKMEEWGVSWAEVTGGGGMGGNSGGMGGNSGDNSNNNNDTNGNDFGGDNNGGDFGGDFGGNGFNMDGSFNPQPTADEYAQYKYVLQTLYSILETNAKDYNNAVESYEKAKDELSYNLLSLQLDMSTLEETYLNAQKSYESNLLSAEQTRQTAKTNAELAQSEYEAKVEKAKTDY